MAIEDRSPVVLGRLSLDLVGEGWRLFRSRLDLWLPAMLVWFVLQLTLDQVDRRLGAGGAFAFGGLIGKGVGLLVNSFLTAGMVQIALKQVRGESAGVGDLFTGGRFFLTIAAREVLIGLSALIPVGVILFLLMMGMWSLGPGLKVAVGVIGVLGLVVFAVLTLRWMIVDALIVDQGMGAWEALGESWRALSLEPGTNALIGITLIALQFAGALACGVGLLVTMPLMWIVPVLIYRHYYPNGFTTNLAVEADKVE